MRVPGIFEALTLWGTIILAIPSASDIAAVGPHEEAPVPENDCERDTLKAGDDEVARGKLAETYPL